MNGKWLGSCLRPIGRYLALAQNFGRRPGAQGHAHFCPNLKNSNSLSKRLLVTRGCSIEPVEALEFRKIGFKLILQSVFAISAKNATWCGKIDKNSNSLFEVIFWCSIEPVTALEFRKNSFKLIRPLVFAISAKT